MYVEKTLTRKVSNDPTKVDTIRIGEVDFPYATVGLEKAMPYVRIMSNVTSTKSFCVRPYSPHRLHLFDSKGTR